MRRKANETSKPGFGHICTGGGATISNSPINIHIHIHAQGEGMGQRIARKVGGLFTTSRHSKIEEASRFSEDQLRGQLIRIIEHG